MKRIGKTIAWVLSLAMIVAMIPAFAVVSSADGAGPYLVGSDSYQTFAEAQAAAQLTDKTITLNSASGIVEDNISIEDGKSYILNLNNCVLKAADADSPVIFIKKGSGLTVNDSASSKTKKYFTVNTNGLWVLSDSTTENYVEGGAITGGAYGIQNAGTLVLNSGNVVGNSYQYAGGVQNVSAAEFTMTGGSITGNYSSTNSGGVANQTNATFTMKGGTIEENRAASNGGGMMNTGTFIMEGGSFEGNSAGNNGGGIWSKGTLTISGKVTVKNNYKGSDTKAASNIYLNEGNVLTLAGELDPASILRVTVKTNPEKGSPVVITASWSAYMNGKAPKDYFLADNSRLVSVGEDLSDGEACLVYDPKPENNLQDSDSFFQMIGKWFSSFIENMPFFAFIAVIFSEIIKIFA